MANEPDRRIGWPVLVVLLVFFAGSAYLAFHAYESSVRDLGPSSPPHRARLEDPEGPDTYLHHAWAHDGGAETGGSTAAADPTGQDRVYDPQRWGMLRSFGVSSLDAGVELPFAPIEVVIEITESSGAVPVDERASCALRLLPVRDGTFNCLVRVLCDGRVLYPNQSQTAGYVSCRVDGERVLGAEDRDHTALDGDPRVRIDLEAGTVRVDDRGDGVERFSVTLRVRR